MSQTANETAASTLAAVDACPRPRWQAQRRRHEQRVDTALAGHLARRSRHEKHPVEDFLFTYYSFTPAQLRRWTPGVGVAIRLDDDDASHSVGFDEHDSDDSERLRDHVVHGVRGRGSGRVLQLDREAFLRRRGEVVGHIKALLEATASRPAQLGCFGLHEWAMVYRSPAHGVRHNAWPLRLGSAGTNAVVDAHRLRCSHFDAFRFFTDEAVPRNDVHPTRELQVSLEQPGCLHATMDLYKWAYKLSPATSSSLVLDCFELARDVRALDMRAAPYDLSALGYQPVRIETAEGKAEYVAAQRVFAQRAAPLRAAIVGVCEQLTGGV